MAITQVSPPDLRLLRDLTLSGHAPTYGNLAGRSPVYPAIGAGRTAIIWVTGQSDSAGAATDGLYTLANPTKIKNLYIDNGGVYPAVEPLLGHGGAGGCWPIQVIDHLISNGKLDNALIIPFGVGSSRADQHAPGGPLHHRIIAAIKCVDDLVLTATYKMFWWHQGESDCIAGTSFASMNTSLTGIFSVVKQLVPMISIHVCKVSYAFGATSANVIAAQNARINPSNGIYDFGDYDGIASGHRLFDIDYAAAGMIDAAAIALPKITSYLDTH